MRIDDENGLCLISGADDEAEPAGYFIVQIDAAGASLEFLGEELTQRDGVQALAIGDHRLDFTLDPASAVGAQMPRVRVTSREAIGLAVKSALKKAFGDRVREA
ncbi:hypothetical protein GCM10007884_38290 [Methylobacterium brachythecii]|uniref:Uncharacterized protein n=1 Tax=Methylobacterium brachythecii TaxID=1176177 RepID=A0ABQ6D658_9HYPH|nr:hypothetical protein GCM10007884_38290 [Methylobacterium brachythecii]